MRPSGKQRHLGLEIELVTKYDVHEVDSFIEAAGLEYHVEATTDSSIIVATKAQANALDLLIQKQAELESATDREWERTPVNFDVINEIDDQLSDLRDSIDILEDTIEDNDLCGIELRVLVPETEVAWIKPKLKALLKKLKATVNKSCGLHVHLDMRFEKVVTCGSRLFAKQKQMHSMVDKSRLNNKYCGPVTRTELMDALEGDDYGSRYKDINGQSYNKFKTIEVRLKEGTLNVDDMFNWAAYLSNVAYNKKHTAAIKRYVKTKAK